MEKIIFKKEQFESMTRVLKAQMIENCIKSISDNNSVEIDEVDYSELSDFIYWLVDNI